MFTPSIAGYRQLLVTVAALLVLIGCEGQPGNNTSDGSTVTTVSASEASTSEGSFCDSGDAGNLADPCMISTVEQLQAIGETRDARDGHYALAGDIDASVTREWGVGEEDGEGGGFKPIRELGGSLDGRGHTISGLYIDHRDSYSLVGMFSQSSEESQIRDLRLKDFEITTESTAGLLVGQAKGVIEGVHAHGELNGGGRTGGLVGTLAEGASIVDSSTTGTVIASEARAGGLVGQNNGTISTSFSLSAVHGPSEVGGLVGRSEGTVEQSYSLVGYPDAPEEEMVTARLSHVAGLIGVIERSAVIRDSYTVSYAGPSRFDFAGLRLVADDWGDAEHVSSSYWGTENRTARGSVGERKLIAEMQQAATYEGWDFDTVWTIAEGEGFPDLRSNPRP